MSFGFNRESSVVHRAPPGTAEGPDGSTALGHPARPLPL